jgi:transcriptional regulator with XRE-family HTH domain
MQTLQELGEAVAARRKHMGLQQVAVAAQAGVTPESLSRFERGRARSLVRANCWRCWVRS